MEHTLSTLWMKAQKSSQINLQIVYDRCQKTVIIKLYLDNAKSCMLKAATDAVEERKVNKFKGS